MSQGGPPVTPETLFQAASISKPVTAMGVLHFVQEKKLSLDADVNTELTDWRIPPHTKFSRAVTLRELLTHTGGISVHGFPGYASDKPVPSLLQILDGVSPANTSPIRIEAELEASGTTRAAGTQSCSSCWWIRAKSRLRR